MMKMNGKIILLELSLNSSGYILEKKVAEIEKFTEKTIILKGNNPTHLTRILRPRLRQVECFKPNGVLNMHYQVLITDTDDEGKYIKMLQEALSTFYERNWNTMTKFREFLNEGYRLIQ